MKAQTLSTLVALASSLQSVTATGWKDFQSFKCPQNSHDDCNPSQYGGFDWSDLPTGGFSSYNNFDFEGFSCTNTFGKRDQLTGRTFAPKCISGSSQKEPSKCPKVKGKDSFSIDHLEISVEFDVELEFHYGMQDGSVCKHKTSCSKSGTTVKNTQCGGAKDVTIVIPNPPKTKPTCSVGIHSIGFHCPTTTKTTAKATTTPKPATSTSSTPVYTTPATTSPVASSSSSTSATSAPSASVSTSAPYTSTVSTAPEASSSVSSTPEASSSVSSTPEASSSVSSSAPSSSASSTEAISTSSVYTTPATSSSSAPADSSAVSSSSVVVSTSYTPAPPPATTTPPPATSYTTLVVETTVTTCPVTNTYTTGSVTSIEVTQTVSTITTTRTATVCDKCEHPVTSSIGVSPSSSVSPPQPPAPCPDILPSCLNTWLSIVTECSSNDDKDCYCPNSNFTTLVFGCLSAHGASDDEISSAQTYFQGICAQYVPQNPAIVTAAPPVTITATAPIVGPVTTIEVYTTVIVPCTETNGPASTTTVISSAVTVPQVIFTTLTGTGVGLVPGTPAPVVATATPAPGKTTFATVAPTKIAANATGPTSPKFTGAASKSSAAFSIIGAAIAFSLFAM